MSYDLQPDQVFNIKGAFDFLKAEKMIKETLTLDAFTCQVDKGHWPFFKHPGSRNRVVMKSKLLEAFHRPQLEAIRQLIDLK